MEEKNHSNALIALLAGAVIGVGVGILFAPDKGSKTRKKIKNKLKNSKDSLVNMGADVSNYFKEKTNDIEERFEDKVDEFIQSGREKSVDVITILEEKLAALKKQVNEKEDGI